MLRILLGAGALAALAASGAQAVEPAPGARLGVTLDAISDALGESGWALTRFERDDGRIEVYAVREDRRLEIEIDPVDGEVMHMEARGRYGPWPLPGLADAEIRRRLVAEGYEILEYERGRGRIEVDVRRDGRRWELDLDPRDGTVVQRDGDDD